MVINTETHIRSISWEWGNKEFSSLKGTFISHTPLQALRCHYGREDRVQESRYWRIRRKQCLLHTARRPHSLNSQLWQQTPPLYKFKPTKSQNAEGRWAGRTIPSKGFTSNWSLWREEGSVFLGAYSFISHCAPVKAECPGVYGQHKLNLMWKLQKWLRSKEYWLCFQRTWVQIPAPT